MGMILFAKGDLIQLIHNAGEFEQQGCLWDSMYNLRRMSKMQNDFLVKGPKGQILVKGPSSLLKPYFLE